MTYCCAHLYGDFESYKKMLEEIEFSSGDTLYLLGNMIDKGVDGIKILLDMMGRANVYPILGEQEAVAYKCLSKLPVDVKEEDMKNLSPDQLAMVKEWIVDFQGSGTMTAFLALSEEYREGILEYFEEMSLYEELTVGKRDFVLVHGGLGNFSEDKDLEDYVPEEVLTERMDYGREYFSDRYLISGHTATWSIEENGGKSVIYQGNQHIAIDCDFPEGELACICLDTLKEYYV